MPNTSDDATAVTETTHFKAYLDQVKGRVTDAAALAKIQNDPAADDFDYYLNQKFNSTEFLNEIGKNNPSDDNSKPMTKSDSLEVYGKQMAKGMVGMMKLFNMNLSLQFLNDTNDYFCYSFSKMVVCNDCI